MTALIIIILVYLVSLFLSWNYFKIAYGKNGRWSNLKIEPIDYVLIVTPLLNTLLCFIGYILHYPIRNNHG